MLDYERDDGATELSLSATASDMASLYSAAQAARPAGGASLGDSAKCLLLHDLLRAVAVEAPSDRWVIVSNFTQTLDKLAQICDGLSMTHCRLDGGTKAADRSELVDGFNRRGGANVFLLSAKAGGMGLTLTGANRLLIFDCDWNPAIDAQAMARIWRDGQRKPCHIYRLVLAGGVEEKILQRQLSKEKLADMMGGYKVILLEDPCR